MSDLIKRMADAANASRNADGESVALTDAIDEIERLTAENASFIALSHVAQWDIKRLTKDLQDWVDVADQLRGRIEKLEKVLDAAKDVIDPNSGSIEIVRREGILRKAIAEVSDD